MGIFDEIKKGANAIIKPHTEAFDWITGKKEGEKAAEADAKAREAYEKAFSQYDGISTPEFNDEGYNYLGDISAEQVDLGSGISLQGYAPEQIEAINQAESEMAGINTDSRYQDAQLAALDSLNEVSEGGLTAADKAALARVQSDVATQDRGRREAIRQNMAMQGMAGSGNDLLAQLSSSQAATDRASQAGLDIAGMSQQRALDAMVQAGNMGSQMRSQEFGEKSQTAQAQDAINRFNTANQNSANQWNAANSNDAARYKADANNQASLYNSDLAAEQATFNANARQDANQANWAARQSTANQNVDRNDRTTQQSYDNTVGLANQKANAAVGQGSFYQGQGDRHAQTKAGRQEGLLGMAGSAGSAAIMASDERKKKNVVSIGADELEEFLNSVKPKKYRYKQPDTHGAGERVGFMVQDIEDSDIGESIAITMEDGTKGIDTNNLLGVIVDSLAHLNSKKKDK